MQQTRLSHHTTDSELCIWWHLGYAADTRHMGLSHLLADAMLTMHIALLSQRNVTNLYDEQQNKSWLMYSPTKACTVTAYLLPDSKKSVVREWK